MAVDSERSVFFWGEVARTFVLYRIVDRGFRTFDL